MSEPSPVIQQVAERLQALTAREKRVLAMRFAFDGRGNRSLADIATVLHLTADEVRQIEHEALLTLCGSEA